MFMAFLMRNKPSNQAPWPSHRLMGTSTPKTLTLYTSCTCVWLLLLHPKPKIIHDQKLSKISVFLIFYHHLVTFLSGHTCMYKNSKTMYIGQLPPMHSDTWHTPLMHNLYMHDLCTCVASQNHKKTSPKGPWVGPHHRAKTHHICPPNLLETLSSVSTIYMNASHDSYHIRLQPYPIHLFLMHHSIYVLELIGPIVKDFMHHKQSFPSYFELRLKGGIQCIVIPHN